MDHADGVQVVEAAQQLLQNSPDGVLVELGPGLDEVDDGAPVAELSYHLIPFIPLEHLVEFDDVGVIHFLEELQLCKNFVLLGLAEVLLLDDLDRPGLPGSKALGSVDAAICPLPHY